MVSRKKYLSTRLLTLTIYLLISLISSSYCIGATQNNIEVTDYKGLRIIKYKDTYLSISTNKTKNINLVTKSNKISQNLSKKNTLITFDNPKGKIIFDYDKSKSSQIKILNHLRLYNSKCPESANLELLKDLADNKLIKKINNALFNFDSSKIINKQSCGNKSEDVSLLLEKSISDPVSSISKCYQRILEDKTNNISKDFKEYSDLAFLNFYKLREDILKKESPVKITCSTEDKKPASFDTETKVINLNMDKILKHKPEDSQYLFLNHEFAHLNQEYVKDIPESFKKNNSNSTSCYYRCMNEETTMAFENFCNGVTKTGKDFSYSNFEKKCDDFVKSKKCEVDFKVQEKTQVLINDAKLKDNINSGENNMTGNIANEKQNKDHTKNTTKALHPDMMSNTEIKTKEAQLTKATKGVTYSIPTDQEYAKLIAPVKAGTSEGKTYRIAANSEYGQVVQKTVNNLESPTNILATKVNAIMGATTQPVQATGTTTTLTSSNSTRTIPTATTAQRLPATTATTSSPNLTNTINPNTNPNTTSINTIANNNSNQVVANPSSSAALTNELNPDSSGPSISNPNQQRVSGMASPNKASGAGNGSAQRNVSSVSSSAPALSNGSGGGNSSNNSGRISNSSSSNNEVIQTIQSLKSFNSISGSLYSKTKNQFSNSQFNNLLQTYDMRILTKNSKGQPIAIGASSQKAKKVFNDIGTALKSVENTKK